MKTEILNSSSPMFLALDPESLRRQLPDKPGVYLFKDPSNQILYVGKAKSLKKRVLSYLKSPQELSHKTAKMMHRVGGMEFIMTTTDKEAFILESTLIKKHLPRYNIVLRDDKQYPWLRFNMEERYPRLSIIRKPQKDGARYFGPFTSAQAVRRTLKVIDRIFLLRKCKGKELPGRKRPCLNFQLGRCLGPCAHDIAPDAYRELAEQVLLFLEGRSQDLLRELRRQMEQSSEGLEFEKAAKLRDQIRAVERTMEPQDMVSPEMEDRDIIGLAEKDGAFQMVILFIRKGHLMGSRPFFIKGKGEDPHEVMEAFLKQYYFQEPFIPRQILVSHPVEDYVSIAEWISELAGKKVGIEHPLRGEKRRLVRIALANARNLLNSMGRDQKQDLLGIAQSVLKLKTLPRAIEGLDISNLYGDQAVGALVSFVDGLPHKPGYRNYRIQEVEGIDDYAMMAEIVTRRVISDEPPPDLFVVDGGKGHLMAVKKAVDLILREKSPDIVAIAKEDATGQGDRVYLPGRKNPLPLRRDHPVLLLLMRIRDEVHRRAIGYHRKLKRKDLKRSELDHIPGMGAKRKRILLSHFGSLEAIRKATLQEISSLPEIPSSLAEKIVNALRGISHEQ